MVDLHIYQRQAGWWRRAGYEITARRAAAVIAALGLDENDLVQWDDRVATVGDWIADPWRAGL